VRRAVIVVLGPVLALRAVAACSAKPPSDIGGDVPLPDRLEAGADADAAPDVVTGGDDDAADDAAAPLDASPDVDAGCSGPACERVVFATSGAFVGNALGGLLGADAKCQAAADASTHARVKGRRFHAWLSTTATAVTDRLVHGTLAYRKPGGTVVASNWTDLTKGTLQSGIGEDENGVAVSGSAWTGSTNAGLNGPNQCDAWTITGNQGRTGNVGGAGGGWSDAVDKPCSNANRLYCFEE
jgi:hypothetical protein